MEMKAGLHQQMRQTLIITQRLQQALKLLQMPTLELQQALKMELERNPMLEEVDEVEEVQEIDDAKEESGLKESEQPETADGTPDGTPEEQKIEWEDFWPDSMWDGPVAPRTDDPGEEFYEKVPVTVKSLSEHLSEQLRLTGIGELELSIGDYLIGSIDENGYLQTT
ncbi:MAG TPA: hypothetical protein VK123_00350, partial [Candidatus Limnocylindrales bacterium]|nr:hypothetical protein [Candidatus Limnocylindrales bacterium]